MGAAVTVTATPWRAPGRLILVPLGLWLSPRRHSRPGLFLSGCVTTASNSLRQSAQSLYNRPRGRCHGDLLYSTEAAEQLGNPTVKHEHQLRVGASRQLRRQVVSTSGSHCTRWLRVKAGHDKTPSQRAVSGQVESRSGSETEDMTNECTIVQRTIARHCAASGRRAPRLGVSYGRCVGRDGSRASGGRWTARVARAARRRSGVGQARLERLQPHLRQPTMDLTQSAPGVVTYYG